MSSVGRNEFSPRERGLLIGHKWAESYDGDAADLQRVAEGEIPADLREGIVALLVESDDIENPTAFWEGFAHGVRAFIVEQRALDA